MNNLGRSNLYQNETQFFLIIIIIIDCFFQHIAALKLWIGIF